MNKELLPFQMGYLPEFYQRKAELELNDFPENRIKGLKLLWEKIRDDTDFDGLTGDDDFLLQYLRCKKFNVDRAFSQLKASLNFRKKYSTIFTDFNFEKLSIVTRNKLGTFLPYRCGDGCAVVIIKLDNWIPEEFPVVEVKRIAVIAMLQSLRDPMTQVNGYKAIFDFRANPLRHLRYATPSNLYQLYRGVFDCAPGRVKAIHIINESFLCKFCYTIMKPLLSAKLRKRIYFHDKPGLLLNFFPAAVIPVEYGGELEDYDMTDWLRYATSPEMLETLGGGASSQITAS